MLRQFHSFVCQKKICFFFHIFHYMRVSNSSNAPIVALTIRETTENIDNVANNNKKKIWRKKRHLLLKFGKKKEHDKYKSLYI